MKQIYINNIEFAKRMIEMERKIESNSTKEWEINQAQLSIITWEIYIRKNEAKLLEELNNVK